MSESPDGEAFVRLAGVGRRFGGVQALADIDLTVARGTVHALVGENGAGKSTLGKIIAGVERPDAGTMEVGGRAVRYRGPWDALADGITVVGQELALVPRRTVIENVFLGTGPRRLGMFVSTRRLQAQYRELCEFAGFHVPPELVVGGLRVAEQQRVVILRALARQAALIVMDEPTAALAVDEAGRLRDVVRHLRAQGTTIVYVSHFLDEVLAISDVITVLRDGVHVSTGPAEQQTPTTLVTQMLGHPMEVSFPPKSSPPEGQVVLSVRGARKEPAVADVSFDLREGEILGLAGLVGSGRTELLRCIAGADRADGGDLTLMGDRVEPRSPGHAQRLGVVMLPESRKDQGLHLDRSIAFNITLPHLREISRLGMVRPRRERRSVAELMLQLDVRAADQRSAVGSLSGGNQQKVLFAKWLYDRPSVLLLDEPTRGIDVGAKRAIYELIAELSAQGMAIVIVSSELEEVLGLAHRVLVMREGRIVHEISGPEATIETVMHAAFGSALA